VVVSRNQRQFTLILDGRVEATAVVRYATFQKEINASTCYATCNTISTADSKQKKKNNIARDGVLLDQLVLIQLACVHGTGRYTTEFTKPIAEFYSKQGKHS
jgi:hypothetical protein